VKGIVKLHLVLTANVTENSSSSPAVMDKRALIARYCSNQRGRDRSIAEIADHAEMRATRRRGFGLSQRPVASGGTIISVRTESARVWSCASSG
jgi:hypothetical protein